MSNQHETVEFPITNKYTFARVFSKPENARPLLGAVLGVPIGDIRYVVPEHGIDPSLRGHGVRMDVFVADGTGTVYDVEMQNADEGNLPLRSRYLLSSFDRDRLAHGKDYKELGKSVVIFVCVFDPLGYGERAYVVVPMVRGHDEQFDDGTMCVFLNARGASKEPGEGRLAAFLSYVDGGDTMGDTWVENLDHEVHLLNADEGWRDAVLSFELDLQDAERRGREEEAEANRALARELLARGRESELSGALLDDGIRQRLLAEFGITQPDFAEDGPEE